MRCVRRNGQAVAVINTRKTNAARGQKSVASTKPRDLHFATMTIATIPIIPRKAVIVRAS